MDNIKNVVFSDVFHIHDEVASALASKQPIVALESTIITHGMPKTHNIRHVSFLSVNPI